MPKQQINLLINEALESFSGWLNTNQWRGKEHDCVNLFAHKFLLEKIKKDDVIRDPAQICIECGVKQPDSGNYIKKLVRKDLVIWKEPFQNSWSEKWEPVNIPLVVMEWKVKFKSKLSKLIFDKEDEKWIRLYTNENPDCIGYIISVDLISNPRKVYWRYSKKGVFSEQWCR